MKECEESSLGRNTERCQRVKWRRSVPEEKLGRSKGMRCQEDEEGSSRFTENYTEFKKKKYQGTHRTHRFTQPQRDSHKRQNRQRSCLSFLLVFLCFFLCFFLFWSWTCPFVSRILWHRRCRRCLIHTWLPPLTTHSFTILLLLLLRLDTDRQRKWMWNKTVLWMRRGIPMKRGRDR